MKDLIKRILKEAAEQPVNPPNDEQEIDNQEDGEDRLTGWVNVKIDKEVRIRVERLMEGLGFSHGELEAKMEFLSDPINFNYTEESLGQNIRAKITAIIVLEYLREIRKNFHATSAGFLFESFMAGLIGGSEEKGNRAIDIRDNEGNGYQLKLYGMNTSIPVISEREFQVDPPDYIIVGLKLGDNPGGDIDVRYMDYIDFFENCTLNSVGKLHMPSGRFRRLSTSLGVLPLNNLLNLSQQISEDLMSDVGGLWETISQLHYNVESMITGIDEQGNVKKIESSAEQALNNTKQIDSMIYKIFSDLSDLD